MGSKHVIDSQNVPVTDHSAGEHFAVRVRRLGEAASGRALGCSLCEVPPGKTAWPFHYHLTNEEAIYVLEGRATLRFGPDRIPLTSGDYVALPPREDLAHQITNTGDEPFRYLSISTMLDPDVVYYPDSKKVGVVGKRGDRVHFGFFPKDAGVGYWDGEPVGDAKDPVQEQVEEDLDELRAKITSDPEPERKKSFRERVEAKVEELKRTVGERLGGSDEDEDEAALERQIDDEIEQLKKKLKL